MDEALIITDAFVSGYAALARERPSARASRRLLPSSRVHYLIESSFTSIPAVHDKNGAPVLCLIEEKDDDEKCDYIHGLISLVNIAIAPSSPTAPPGRRRELSL